jgi:WD40 repeat protein/energy-coupling factor transporter ATP-binding protein EcfA2
LADLFLSHAEADTVLAALTAEALRQAGHFVFLDSDSKHGIAPASSWQRELFRELRVCEAVIYLNSRDAQSSAWCHSELFVATELGKRVYSVDIAKDLSPHPLLLTVQGIQLTSSIEDSLERLIEGLRLDGLARDSRPHWSRQRPPYPGLAAMDIEDAGVFFGRDAEVRDLIARVDAPLSRGEGDLVIVMGPSGSGKSSLVRAGLLARLAREGSGWVVAKPFEPGSRPIDRLVSRLHELAPENMSEAECRSRMEGNGLAELCEYVVEHAGADARRLIITLDQAEQLVTVTAPSVAEAFLSIVASAFGPGSPVTVVMSIRSDRFDQFQHLPKIGATIRDPFVIAPMGKSQLSAVIEGPASQADCTFSPGLVGSLIDDAVGRSGEAVDALPLLAFVLREMYELVVSGGRRTFTADDYDRVGRIQGAIIKRTTAAESLLPVHSEVVLERLLARFVTMSEERMPTGQPVARSQLDPAELLIVEKLEDQRLLTGSGGSIRLAHEQLITAWPRLALAVSERRDDLIYQARIRRQASDWSEGTGEVLGRDASEVAAAWLKRNPEVGQDSDIAEYIKASQSAVRRRHRRRLSLAVGVAVLALAASVIAVWALQQRSTAIAQTRLAQADDVAASSELLTSTDPSLGILLSLQAYEEAPNPLTRTAILEAASIPLQGTVSDAGTPFFFTSDGTIIATLHGPIYAYTGLRLWHSSTNREIENKLLASNVGGVLALAPNGQTMVLDAKSAELVDTGTGEPLTTPVAKRIESYEKSYLIPLAATFSPNGKLLAVYWQPDIGPYSQMSVQIFNMETGRLVTTLNPEVHNRVAPDFGSIPNNNLLSFSADGRTLAVENSEFGVYLFDPLSGKRISSLPAGSAYFELAFSPRGRTLVTLPQFGSIDLWNATTRRLVSSLPQQLSVDSYAGGSFAVSPNGHFIATGDAVADVRVWDMDTGALVATLPGTASATNFSFSADGRVLATEDSTGAVVLWSVSGWKPRSKLVLDASATQVAFGSRGEELAVSDTNGNVTLWDEGADSRTDVVEDGTSVSTLAFSSDSRLLAIGDSTDAVRVVNASSGSPLPSIPDFAGATGIAFAPGGRTVAIAENGAVEVWSVSRRGRNTTWVAAAKADDIMNSTGANGGYGIAFSPNGGLLATTGVEGGCTNSVLALYDTSNWKRYRCLAGDDSSEETVAFSSNGKIVASGDDTGKVVLWSVPSGRRIARLRSGGPAVATISNAELPVTPVVAFSPTGSLLAIGGVDGTVALWNATTMKEVEKVTENGAITSMAFSPDGRTIAVGDALGNVFLMTAPSLHDIAVLSDGASVGSISFSPNGKFLAFGDTRGKVTLIRDGLWDWSLAMFRRTLCSEVNRNMTAEEWNGSVPNQAYQRTCPSIR